MAPLPRVAIVYNPDKLQAEVTMASLVTSLADRAEVVATGVVAEVPKLACDRADRLIVLGGDGSILAAARSLTDRQIPIVGVNFGKLGFLAEFSVEALEEHLEAVLTDTAIVSQRMMIEATIRRDSAPVTRLVAANDCVVHAGPPYRMIELSMAVDDVELTRVGGDGLVLATPSGSTAHNMSAGGPIVQPVTRAIVLSPINPHSLTHRPLVVAGDSVIDVVAVQVNLGTTLVIDGQVSMPIEKGDRITVRRWPHNFQLVQNPGQPKWHTLTTKLKWGQ